MGYAATAERLAQTVQVLDAIDDHDRWCGSRGEDCPSAAIAREWILQRELRDLAVATAISEMDEKIRAVRAVVQKEGISA